MGTGKNTSFVEHSLVFTHHTRNSTDVSIEEIEMARRNLEEFSNLKNFFGEKWLNSHLEIEERSKKHPIFWELIDRKKCFNLSNNLSILNSKCNKFSRIVNKLKSDILNFYSFLSETEVLAYYYTKYDSKELEYEPEIDGLTTKVEAKLTIEGEEYYLEVLTIFKDEEGQSLFNIRNEIAKEIENIERSRTILFGTEIDFTKQDISGFVNFIKGLSSKGSIKNNDSFEYFKNNRRIATVTFFECPNGKNREILSRLARDSNTSSGINTSRRIKNSILTKIDKRQLPENTKNIVIVNLSHIPTDFRYDIEDAFLGQCDIDCENSELRHYKRSNGIIHDRRGKFISALVAYKNHDYSHRGYLLNPLAQKVIDEKTAERIILD